MSWEEMMSRAITTDKVQGAELKKRLLEIGLLTEIKPPLPTEEVDRNRTPIVVVGNPVSDLLIRERR